MSAKQLNIRPNAVLTVATYSGLAALARLAERRHNYRTRKFCNSIEKTWRVAREGLREVTKHNPRDFSSVQNSESNLRGLYLKMLWYSTKPFGNKEFKRVYSWREGTVGPLNALLNYAGAMLRELAITRYPFPDPVFFQVRLYSDGCVRILSKRVAETNPKDNATKVYWRAGYRGSAKHPRVLLSHPTLPGLDFVDMIRAHVVELCRQCFIYSVPRSEAQKYIRLLIHRMKPFLDWVYTQGGSGRKDFFPDADRELRKIVLEIRALYGRRLGRTETVTRRLSDGFPAPTVNMLRRSSTEILDSTDDEAVKKGCIEILDKIDQGIIVDRDVTMLIEHVLALSQKEGNDWHRILLSGLHHPASLKSVVFSGDTMLDHPGDVLTVGELPLASPEGMGQADIAVFVRREFSGRTVWTPVMLLELKTKTAFDYNLYSERSRSKKDNVPTSYVWKTACTDEEWQTITTSILSERTLNQLDAYEHGLLHEYNQLAVDDPFPPASLWKGVVLIDTSQSYSKVFEAFQQMLTTIATKLHSLGSEAPAWTLHSFKANEKDAEEPPRIVVLVSPSHGPTHLIGKTTPLEATLIENPFEYRVGDDRLLSLYISVSSPTSYGRAAAWMSKNWHLLNHLQECIQTSQHKPRVVWLDLLNDYPTKQLLKVRFSLETLRRNREITAGQYRTLSDLLQDIEFIGLGAEVDEYLFMNLESELQTLRTKIDNTVDGESIFIIDGWAELHDMVPSNRQHLLRAVENAILDTLPRTNTNIVWIDRAVPHTKMNSLYQCRCVRPLPHDSPRQLQIDEIIWNMPVTPRVFGWQTPRRTDVRLIIQDTPTSAPPWITMIQVPHLKGWARKFRGVSRRDKTVDRSRIIESTETRKPMYGHSVSLSSIHADLSPLAEDTISQIEYEGFTLAPSLLRSRKKEPLLTSREEESLPWTVVSSSLILSEQTVSLTDRLHLCPSRSPPIPNRAKKMYFSLSRATRGWEYGSIPSPAEYSDDWQGTTRRPPLTKTTEQVKVDTLEIRRRELRRLLYAARFLNRRVSSVSNLCNCCEDIIHCCEKALSKPYDADSLFEALILVKKHILGNTRRASAWQLLYRTRQELVEVLSSLNRKTLQGAMNENEDILMLYGNNLLLAVFAVAERIFGDILSPLVIHLWSAVAEWQLYQMGFQPKDSHQSEAVSRYDFQAIYSNLLRRAKALRGIPRPSKPQLIERFGQVVWMEHDDQFNIWLVFPQGQKGSMLGGLFLDQQSLIPRQGWYRGAIDPEQLCENAKLALDGWNRTPIVVTQVLGHSPLWMRVEHEEGNDWSFIGVLEYGTPPRGKKHPIRWLRIKNPSPEVYLAIQGYKPSSYPSDLNKPVDRVLREATSWAGIIKDVTCVITVDAERNLYRVDCRETAASGIKVLATKETPYTNEVIRFLRYPHRTGEYLVSEDGIHLRWDHLRDVEYDDVVLKGPDGDGEWLSMTFLKPLVHRFSFYPDCYNMPQTSRELIETSLGEDVRFVIDTDDRLKASGSHKHLRIILDGVSEESNLRGFRNEILGIYDVALLAECEQIVDPIAGTRHTLDIDAKGISGIRIPSGLAGYERLHDAISNTTQEDFEEREYKEERDVEEIEPVGPELRLLNVEVITKSRERVLKVRVYLGELEDKQPSMDLSVIELPTEILKIQAVPRELIDERVMSSLRGLNVNLEVSEEIIKEVCNALEREGVFISYE